MNRRRFALAAPAALLAACTLAACQDKPAASASAAASAGTAGASPAQAPAPDAYALAAKGTGFTVGPVMAAHTVYVFFDPACPHCARLWSAAQPLLSQLKMVWIPVGFLRNSSTPVGATILSAANPVDAMNANESSVMEGGSGLAPAGSVGEAALGKVKANTQHWQAAGAQSVPFLVYKDPKTGQPTTHEGELDTAGLAALVGL